LGSIVKHTLCQTIQLAKLLYGCSVFVMLGYQFKHLFFGAGGPHRRLWLPLKFLLLSANVDDFCIHFDLCSVGGKQTASVKRMQDFIKS
jgi:hypothetical protein